jgi:hypothetical protein
LFHAAIDARNGPRLIWFPSSIDIDASNICDGLVGEPFMKLIANITNRKFIYGLKAFILHRNINEAVSTHPPGDHHVASRILPRQRRRPRRHRARRHAAATPAKVGTASGLIQRARPVPHLAAPYIRTRAAFLLSGDRCLNPPSLQWLR